MSIEEMNIIVDALKRIATRRPIGLTAPYRPKTVLAPNAPWPTAAEPKPEAKPAPKKRYIPKPSNSKRKQTDAKFEQWLAKGLE